MANTSPEQKGPKTAPGVGGAPNLNTSFAANSDTAQANRSPTARIQMDRLLEAMVLNEASDLHLKVGVKPTFRAKGALQTANTSALTEGDLVSAFKQIAAEHVQVKLHEDKSADFACQISDGTRFRVNAYHEMDGIALAIRRLPDRIIPLDELGLPAQLRTIIQKPRGLFLVTGQTGSGKTTTLASLIQEINTTQDAHIISVEQPIEYRFRSNKAVINQREIGQHVKDFTSALREALRQDPDVIMVGEMRDLETIRVALSAAETGHLVLATLHTSSAAKTVDRIIDAFPKEEKEHIRVQISSSLLGVLCQQLVRKKDGSGVMAAFEFMQMTSGISNLIREGKSYNIPSQIQTGARHGMQLLDDHLFRLIKEERISVDEALAHSNERLDLEKRLGISG